MSGPGNCEVHTRVICDWTTMEEAELLLSFNCSSQIFNNANTVEMK